MSTDGLAVKVPNPTHVLMIGQHQSWLAKRGHAKGLSTVSWRGLMREVRRPSRALRVGELVPASG